MTDEALMAIDGIQLASVIGGVINICIVCGLFEWGWDWIIDVCEFAWVADIASNQCPLVWCYVAIIANDGHVQQ